MIHSMKDGSQRMRECFFRKEAAIINRATTVNKCHTGCKHENMLGNPKCVHNSYAAGS